MVRISPASTDKKQWSQPTACIKPQTRQTPIPTNHQNISKHLIEHVLYTPKISQANMMFLWDDLHDRPEDFSAAGRRRSQLCVEINPEDALRNVTLELQAPGAAGSIWRGVSVWKAKDQQRGEILIK